MNSEALDHVLRMIEDNANSTPSAIEFEMAYQSRVAIDRIRFAIKATEQATDEPEQLREAGLELMDALGRLETAERSFQRKFRARVVGGAPAIANLRANGSAVNSDRRERDSNA